MWRLTRRRTLLNELNPRNDYLVLLTSELAPGNTGTPVSIADVTNSAGLIFVSTGATPHNLNTGQTVIISGVVGVPAANGTWTITVVDAYNFTLAGSVFSGDYSSGGTVTGLDGGPGMLINAGFGWTKNEIVTRLGYDSRTDASEPSLGVLSRIWGPWLPTPTQPALRCSPSR